MGNLAKFREKAKGYQNTNLREYKIYKFVYNK